MSDPPPPPPLTERNYVKSLSSALHSGASYEIAALLCPPLPSTSISSTSISSTSSSASASLSPAPVASTHHHPSLSSIPIDYLDSPDVAVAVADWNPAASHGYAVYTYAASPSGVSPPFPAQSALHAALNRLLGQCSGNWLVPAVVHCCRRTYLLALSLDALTKRSSSSASGGENHLERAVTLIQESFSRALNDRREFRAESARLDARSSKKVGVLPIVNVLFGIYFRLGNLRLCKNLLRPVESQGLRDRPVAAAAAERDVADDPLRARAIRGSLGATYRYYVGRLAMFEDQYDGAEEHLGAAWEHCREMGRFQKDTAGEGGMRRNRRRILNYLLPVKMLRGRLPARKFLIRYGLKEFLPLVESIRQGDLRTFNDSLEVYQEVFIRRGTFLLLEKCKSVCYRNLFKRLYLITGLTQLPLSSILVAFRSLQVDIDLDEIECILANLIFRGYVKGYISHAKRILVLSKKDPFPKSAVIK